jgi:hypothetical protein
MRQIGYRQIVDRHEVGRRRVRGCELTELNAPQRETVQQGVAVIMCQSGSKRQVRQNSQPNGKRSHPSA